MIFVAQIVQRLSISFALGLTLAPSSEAHGSPPSPDASTFPSAETVPLDPAIPPPSDVPNACGQPDDIVPAISLIDLNPNSMTYSDHYSLDTFQSEVLVIYWALAS